MLAALTTAETARAAATTTAEAATADRIKSDIRKPSVISADGDFNLVFETSLTKTVAMTKTFLDRHLETLSGVTNNSKDSLLKVIQRVHCEDRFCLGCNYRRTGWIRTVEVNRDAGLETGETIFTVPIHPV